MVVSLASDKDVWESIMKNERVQELKRSYCADKYIQYTTGGIKTEFSAGYPYIVAHILGWVFENAKGKVMQIIEDILSLIIDLFHSRGKENGMEVVSDVV
ncbi:hypothetical protein HPP92_004600 [Vanilla planifolia]|uniref:Uncharacterized protein n=1 Tax=Vanilla planifolia TaxID=51239 RepID=A0A835RRT7_VANPL|nr:hypothetical protein HPP92_004600 [Vanilla planifolia]